MILYQSKNQRVERLSGFLKVSWLETEEMDDATYRAELLRQVELIEAERPEAMFFDTASFAFVIKPETQVWNNETILARVVRTPLRKVAMLVSADLFSQVSIEQNMEEESTGAFATRFFEDEASALAWLLKG